MTQRTLQQTSGTGTAPEEERLARLIRLAARAFRRSLELRLVEEGVTFGQWSFLRILWQHDGLSQRELSERANLTEPTTHAALLRMEKLGILTRRNVGGNRRRQHAFLTDKGWQLQARLEPMAIDANRIAVDGLSEREQKTLRKALIRIIDNLERDEERAAEEGKNVPPTRSSLE